MASVYDTFGRICTQKKIDNILTSRDLDIGQGHSVPSNGATWDRRVTWDKRGWSTYVMNFEITIQLI